MGLWASGRTKAHPLSRGKTKELGAEAGAAKGTGKSAQRQLVLQ